MLQFSNFKAVATANTRDNSHLVHSGQSFNFKYKKFYGKDAKKNQIISSSFTVSNKLFETMGLDEKGMIEIVSPDGISYLAVVDVDNAVLLKGGKIKEGGVKAKVFKSTLLEKALSKQGVIDLDVIGTQKLDLNLVEGSESAYIGEEGKGIQSYGVYEITKAEDSELTDDEKAEDAAEPVEETSTEAEATDNLAEPVAQVSTPVKDEDDF